MEKEIKVPVDEIFNTLVRMKGSLDDEADARVVECACLILIAECNVVLGVKPTEIEEFEETVRPLVLEYMDLFANMKFEEKKLKK